MAFSIYLTICFAGLIGGLMVRKGNETDNPKTDRLFIPKGH